MNFIQRMMYGRYGGDQLSYFLLALYFLLYVLSLVLGVPAFSLVGSVIILWGIFRIFSRNIERRRAENAKFLALVGPAARWCKLRRAMFKDREHRYFKCPKCGQRLRVPRGKGKITVNCRNCGVSFEEKT